MIDYLCFIKAAAEAAAAAAAAASAGANTQCQGKYILLYINGLWSNFHSLFPMQPVLQYTCIFNTGLSESRLKVCTLSRSTGISIIP